MRNFEEIITTYYPDNMIPYPEYKGKPYFSIQYEENGEHRVGYGTFSPQVLSGYIKDDFNYRASMIEEFEKIKAELHKRIKIQYDACFGEDERAVCCFHQAYEVSGIIVDNVFEDRISELKGE